VSAQTVTVLLVHGAFAESASWSPVLTRLRAKSVTSAEWLFDPMDVQREEIGLRSLLGAVEAIEGDDPRNDERTTGR